jgi:hypothetical protein
MNKMMVQEHKLTFLINLLPKKLRSKPLPLYFERSGPPKCPPMKGGCDEQFCSGRKEVYIYTRNITDGCL